MKTQRSNSILDHGEEPNAEDLRGSQTERAYPNTQTIQKKKVCCDEKWRPLFSVEKEKPTMTLRTKGPTKTIYQKDYIKQPLGITRDMKNDLWTTFRNEEPIDFTTTMKNDYKPIKLIKPASRIVSQSLSTLTPFREYVDWKGTKAMMTLPVQPSTLISNLPFLQKTTYRENYIELAKDDDLNEQLRAVNKRKGDSAIFPPIPLLGMSTYHKDYKEFKAVGYIRETRRYDVHGDSAYPGQYQTLSQAEFTDPRKRYHCSNRDEDE